MSQTAAAATAIDRRGSLPRRGSGVLLGLLGGLVYLAIFQWAYSGTDPDFYQYRDDGIITLSHARNWIDFGFIGVNPSGERLEASSAPLQLLLYTIAYGLGRVGYQGFMAAQTLACTFGIGVLVAQLFSVRPLLALLACAGTALALTQLPAFMIWHGSGMENALMHLFLLWTVFLLYRFAVQGRVLFGWAVIPFLASIVRVETIFHVMPLLLVFCLYWHARVGDARARRFTAAVAVLWLLFNLGRFLYFGSLLPNTAVAQGISIGERLAGLASLSPVYLDQSFGLVRTLMSRHGGYLLLLPMLLLVVLRPRLDPASVLLLALSGCLILTALASSFVFGPARLDPARTTTPMALFVVLAVAAAVLRWEPRRASAYLGLLAVLLVFLIHEATATPPYYSCCSPRDFDRTRKVFERIAREQGIARPTVANPDLGVLSWYKQFNVVDLGLLGSSVVPRLHSGPGFNGYFLDHAAPDMIETHGFWTCRYAHMLTDPRFAGMYVEAGEPGRQVQHCKGFAAVPSGVWVRRDVLRGSPSRERLLMDDLAMAPSTERVATELRDCQQAPGATPARCAYVARSVYRVLPEFRARGELNRLEEVFSASRSKPFDLFLLTGAHDGRAGSDAVTYFEPARR